MFPPFFRLLVELQGDKTAAYQLMSSSRCNLAVDSGQCDLHGSRVSVVLTGSMVLRDPGSIERWLSCSGRHV